MQPQWHAYYIAESSIKEHMRAKGKALPPQPPARCELCFGEDPLGCAVCGKKDGASPGTQTKQTTLVVLYELVP